MPDDSLIPGRAAEKVALNGSVLSTVKNGGLGTQSGPITEVAQRESEIPVVYGALS